VDPRRITAVYAMHGNEMTWERHLEVVEHLSCWPLDEIVDFHESLIAHLVKGTWIRTSVNRLVRLDNGSTMSRGHNPWAAAADLPGQVDFVTLRDQVERANAVPDDQIAPEVPDGHIGIPLHPWTEIPGCGPSLRSSAARRALIEAVNDWGAPELEMLLRPAAWAYYRSTGEQLPGVLITHNEAKHEATQQSCNWSRRLEVSRGSERVALVQVYLSFTGADILPGATSGLEKLLRTRLRATLRSVGTPIRVGGNVFAASEPDGQLVWRGEEVIPAQPNPLLLAVRKVLSTPQGGGKPASVLPDDEFWALIDELGENHDDWEALTRALSRKAKARIVSFHETLAAKLHALDLPSLFEVTQEEFPMSEDVFLYVRCAVVAAGRAAYELVLSEGVLRQGDWGEGEAEELLSVAPAAFNLRTGEEIDYETAVSYETGSNAAWGGEGKEEIPRLFVGFSVRSADGGREEIRFWQTNDRTVAIARQGTEVSGAVDAATAFGVVDYRRLPPTLALSGIRYAIAVETG
jgi:hypothetical protein